MKMFYSSPAENYHQRKNARLAICTLIFFLCSLIVGCRRYNAPVTPVNFKGTYKVVLIEGTPHSYLLPDIKIGDGVEILDTGHGCPRFLKNGQYVKISEERAKFKGSKFIYKPYLGAFIILGPTYVSHRDELYFEKDFLVLRSNHFECGLLLFVIPWKEGGFTTIKLRREPNNLPFLLYEIQ